jgi:hypothetical protein
VTEKLLDTVCHLVSQKASESWWSFLQDSKGVHAKAKLHTDDSPSHVHAQRLLQVLEHNQSKWLT